jgi:hypothetical protein
MPPGAAGEVSPLDTANPLQNAGRLMTWEHR